MRSGHPVTTAVIALVLCAACGPTDSAGTTAAQVGSTTSTRSSDGTESTDPPDDTLPEVGFVLEGTAVATSAGGDQACDPRPDGLLPEGLVNGAPVTILDVSSDDVIGTGEVTSTEFVQDESSDAVPPPWTCTFNITAELATETSSFRVQIADLPPQSATLGANGVFTVDIPSEGDDLPPDTTTSLPPSTSTTDFESGSTSSTTVP